MKRDSCKKLIGNMKKFNENDGELRQQLNGLTKNLMHLNKKLHESEALKSRFLSNARNEINNPLTSIIGLSNQIIKGLNLEPDSIQRRAAMIYEEAFDLDFQLRNIFAAAELEAGEVSPWISTVDVDALIQNTIDSFKHKTEEKKVKITCCFRSVYKNKEKKFLKTDTEKLKLILSNLLCNAIEFSSDGGRVELDAKRDGKNLVFSVKDCGIGFDEANKDVIFDRFVQLESGLTRKHGGHGLGLSITKDLVTLLGGTISVTSIKGKGSIFTVIIPDSESAAAVDAFSDDGNVLVF